MHFSRDHHQFPTSYPTQKWKHHPYKSTDDVDLHPSSKRRKLATKSCEDGRSFVMSRDEIERFSPSRKDGIDRYMETRLRYSYCAYLQSLGIRLDLPQMTVGTAMVLCHRFFLRRSHASNDRFLIATAALFLAAKSEETPCLLNSVLSASCEICQKQNFDFFPHLLYADWFELYRDQVVEAEQLILTTLNFELEVEHPYVPLTSVFKKFGLSQTVLLNLAWNLVNEGLRSSLWLQFKPHHIAAGAVFLAAKFLNFDLSIYHHIWQEFQTRAPVLDELIWVAGALKKPGAPPDYETHGAVSNAAVLLEESHDPKQYSC